MIKAVDTFDLSLDGIGVYVHFPWCLKKCPYCDFLSVAVPPPPGADVSTVEFARSHLPHSRYADAVISELTARCRSAWPNRRAADRPQLKSIFFGGGTPSLWDPLALGRCIDAIKGEFPGRDISQELEISVECNPSSVDETHFEVLREQGVNRVSIGVQALNDERLQFLGRWHDEAKALQAIRSAQRAGIPRVSGDLIFGVYKQSPEEAVRDVTKIAETGVSHLSAYSLTIEPGTRFGALDAKGRLPLLEDALVADSFQQVEEALAALGFVHYEISNYARPGEESRHNLGYWLGRDYLGLGTGAFGTMTLSSERLRYRNQLSPERYMNIWNGEIDFDPFSVPLTQREALGSEEAMQEALLLGLRVKAGVSVTDVEAVRGVSARQSERHAMIEQLVSEKRLQRDGNRISLKSSEWIFADRTIRELL